MKRVFCSLALILFAFYSGNVFAELGNQGVLNDVLNTFQASAASWGSIILGHAKTLFLSLLLISCVWTFGTLALQGADIGAFFAELIKFIIFFGLYWWLLTNAIPIASSIVDSFAIIGSQSIAGMGPDKIHGDVVEGGKLSPSGIVDIGFDVISLIIDKSSWKMILPNLIFGGLVLLVMAKIAANVIVMMAGAYLLLYGGIFILGFGGSKWTSDMAINYYKTVLGLGIRLFFMILIIGVGVEFLDTLWTSVDKSGDINLNEIAVLAVASIVLLFLCDTIPEQAALLVGAHIGGGAAGSLSKFMGAASAAASGAAMAAGGAAAGIGGALKAGAAAHQGGKESSGSYLGGAASVAAKGIGGRIGGAVSKATGGKTARSISKAAGQNKPTNAFAVNAAGRNTSTPKAQAQGKSGW